MPAAFTLPADRDAAANMADRSRIAATIRAARSIVQDARRIQTATNRIRARALRDSHAADMLRRAVEAGDTAAELARRAAARAHWLARTYTPPKPPPPRTTAEADRRALALAAEAAAETTR